MTADIELVVDLREYRPQVADAQAFMALWNRLEPALLGRDLRRERVQRFQCGPDGTLALRAVRVVTSGVVGPRTRFSVVSVWERPALRDLCRVCGDYAPHVCAGCATGADRLCDLHATILPGGPRPVCTDHHPRCSAKGCGTAATFRCAGDLCVRDRPWCDRHRHAHPGDRETDYCPGCFEALFPACEEQGCSDAGTIVCEHIRRDGERCRRRRCTRHARRWQVYGPELPGLALCRTHRRDLPEQTADDALFMIVAASACRRPQMRAPSLRAFGYSLREIGQVQLAWDYPQILERLRRIQPSVQAAGIVVSGADSQLARWKRDAAGKAGDRAAGEQRLADRLRQLIRQRDPQQGKAIAEGLQVTDYYPERPEQTGAPAQRAVLYVDVPAALRGRFKGDQNAHLKHYSARLGVTVRLEAQTKRGRKR